MTCTWVPARVAVSLLSLRKVGLQADGIQLLPLSVKLVPKTAAMEPGAKGPAAKLAPFTIPFVPIDGGAVVVMAPKSP